MLLFEAREIMRACEMADADAPLEALIGLGQGGHPTRGLIADLRPPHPTLMTNPDKTYEK